MLTQEELSAVLKTLVEGLKELTPGLESYPYGEHVSVVYLRHGGQHYALSVHVDCEAELKCLTGRWRRVRLRRQLSDPKLVQVFATRLLKEEKP